jgi:predicted transcriptional regulator
MSGKVIITTPFPTPEQVAAYYKIPPKRVAELDEMINEARRSMAKTAARKKSTSRNGTRKSANGSRSSRAKK